MTVREFESFVKAHGYRIYVKHHWPGEEPEAYLEPWGREHALEVPFEALVVRGGRVPRSVAMAKQKLRRKCEALFADAIGQWEQRVSVAVPRVGQRWRVRETDGARLCTVARVDGMIDLKYRGGSMMIPMQCWIEDVREGRCERVGKEATRCDT